MASLIERIKIYHFFLFFAGLVSIVLISPIGDPDFFWHIRTGEYIWQNNFIPHTDPFTQHGILNSAPWVAHEWLCQVIFFLVSKYFGLSALLILPFIVFLVLLYINFILRKESLQRMRPIGFLWIFIFAINCLTFLTVRPLLFSVILFSIVLYLIEKYLKIREFKILIPLPVIAVLWANLHGGSSVLSYLLLIVTALSHLFTFRIGKIYAKRDIKVVKDMMITCGLTMLGLLINPNTYKILIYPFATIVDSRMLDIIGEWNPIGVDQMKMPFYLAVLLFPILISIISTNKMSLQSLILLFMFAIQSINRVRYLEYYFIVATPIVLEFAVSRKIQIDTVKIKKVLLGFAVSLAIFVFTMFSSELIYAFKNPIYNMDSPEGAVETIRNIKPKHLFHECDWGGYLIWRFSKDNIPAFIDGRLEIFPSEMLDDYMDTMYGINVVGNLSKYSIDSVLIRGATPLYFFMKNQSDWNIVYEDKYAVLFNKK